MKTMLAVATSSVPLIDSKTVIASAEKPAPPVTAVSTPGCADSSSRSRASSTGSMIVLDSPFALISAVSSAVVPSRDSFGPR